ncbi:MAG: outer rane efflux protein [Crocinitomicaceae bacterium]|jgi:outer membrane protein TolC|nr:outer rane efflux protein [Crocinitomicaceae bacterium]
MKFYLFLLIPFLALQLSAQENLSLETVVAKVLEANFDVRIERNNVTMAENLNNPGEAGYLPTIGLNADQNWSFNNTRQEFFSGQVNEASNAKNTSTNAALLLNWTFFDGFRMFATDKRLQQQQDIAVLNLNAEMEMKIYQATVLYSTIIQQQRMTEVYQQALDLSIARYQFNEMRVKHGSESELMLIQSRLDLIADSSSLLQHQKNVADLKIDLAQLMGQNPAFQFTLAGEIQSSTPLAWENVAQQAREQNTQLLLAKSAIALTEMQRKEIQSFYYPQLSFYAQYGFGKSQNQIGILNSNRFYGSGFGFTLSWTILDRLSTYTQLKNNVLQTENARLSEQQQALFIENELRKDFNEYEWALTNLRMESQNIVNAEEVLGIAQKTFENGALTSMDLREIQFSVVQAQSRLLIAQLAVKTAELNIALTTGNFKGLLK